MKISQKKSRKPRGLHPIPRNSVTENNMKKLFACTAFTTLILLCLSGCGPVGDRTVNHTIIYAITALLALALLIGYCRMIQAKSKWLLLLFCSVTVVNTAYFLLSISTTLGQALMANRLAYFGSVFLPLSMLMTILNVTNTKHSKWVPGVLFAISVAVFLISASPGILDIYYKEVTFEVVNGVSRLVKVYGPLHSIYLYYLLGYFGAMVAVIFRASYKKLVDTTTHSFILAAAVFVNIGVWLIEQLAQFEFEMLSVSYIISELFLLSVHLVINENKRLKELIREAHAVHNVTPAEAASADVMPESIDATSKEGQDRFMVFIEGVEKLTQTERLIFDAYIARSTTKEIMASLNIKENTLKFHNKNIYSKLGVSSRKELLEIYKQLIAIKENEGCTAAVPKNE